MIDVESVLLMVAVYSFKAVFFCAWLGASSMFLGLKRLLYLYLKV